MFDKIYINFFLKMFQKEISIGLYKNSKYFKQQVVVFLNYF